MPYIQLGILLMLGGVLASIAAGFGVMGKSGLWKRGEGLA
jgi:hypothetical protein